MPIYMWIRMYICKCIHTDKSWRYTSSPEQLFALKNMKIYPNNRTVTTNNTLLDNFIYNLCSKHYLIRTRILFIPVSVIPHDKLLVVVQVLSPLVHRGLNACEVINRESIKVYKSHKNSICKLIPTQRVTKWIHYTRHRKGCKQTHTDVPSRMTLTTHV